MLVVHPFQSVSSGVGYADGSGKGRDENVWRSVFNPGSTNRDRMDALGASKFDKADPKGPSVYDWYNPLLTT